MNSVPRYTLLLGAGALAAGVTALVCRYVFLPFGLSGFWGALFTGGPIGLVVTGIQQIRVARRNGISAPASRVLPTILLPALVVVGCFLVYQATRPNPITDPLQRTELAGVTVSLPAWEVASSNEQWTSGHHEVAPPTGNGRFLKLSWELGGPFTTDEIVSLLTGSGLTEKSRSSTTVSGHPAETILLASDGKRVAATHWHCQEDGRELHLMTFLDLSEEDLLTLHDRVLGSLACHESSGEKPVFPLFTPPDGFERIENPAAALFANELGQVYDFSFGKKGSTVMADIARTPGLRERLVALEFNLVDVTFEAQPRMHRNAAGEMQPVWFADVRDEENSRLRVLFTGMYCQGSDLSFLGIYLGPPEISDEEAVQPLVTARCPPSDQ